MMMHLSHHRRWLLYPSLLIWWLWSSMALCYAQQPAPLSAPAEHDNSMTMHDHATAMHDHKENRTSQADHQGSVAAASHDCCADVELAACCGPADVLQTKFSLDLEPQFAAVLLSWLTVVAEPVSVTFPTVDTVASHAVFPRLHLLLSVFLD